MCCRYVLLQEHAKTLLEKLGALLEAGAAPPPSRYNIPPGGRILAVRNRPAPSAPARETASLHWGLVPAWARDRQNPVVNARAETLSAKPTFREALRSRRCLIPASAFYEWQPAGRARQPWLFRPHDERPFAFAGLWETWRSPEGETLESCAIVTTAPNGVMQPIHHRMPVILPDAAAWHAWLEPRSLSTDTLDALLRPPPDAALAATPLNPRVNDIRNDDPACLAPASAIQASFGF